METDSHDDKLDILGMTLQMKERLPILLELYLKDEFKDCNITVIAVGHKPNFEIRIEAVKWNREAVYLTISDEKLKNTEIRDMLANALYSGDLINKCTNKLNYILGSNDD